jgi:hypothetical protein
VLVSSSIELAVSSRLLACDSVRLDRSAFPEAISRAAVLIASVASRIWPMMSCRLVDRGVGVVLEFSEQALVIALHLLRQVAFRERLEHLARHL